MTSSVCHRFVQNAWKKERCSNCFKPKDEHASLKRETPVTRRPLTLTTSSNNITHNSKSCGIIKNPDRSIPNRRKRAVSFKQELTEIIGFGGEDWGEGEADEEDPGEDRLSESSEEDIPSFSDDDKDLEKLTKNNTEHNANINVPTTTDRRRTFTQLMLGQPQKDQDGRKQTLLVTVTPFGQPNQEETERVPPKRASKTVSHIPIAKNKEILTEARPKVVLTSYSKNRDSPEPVKMSEKIEKLIEKKDTEVITSPPSIKEKLNNLTNTNNQNEDVRLSNKQGSLGQQQQVEEINNLNNLNKVDNVQNDCEVNSSLISDEFGSASDQDELIEKEPAVIVETVNEISVLKKTEKVNEEQLEEKPVLENNRETVKTELTVHLSPTSNKTFPSDLTPPESSSEESADSLGPAESREQAGEPDGRADSDVPCEPPALPRSPPPMVIAPPPRNSFLHGVNPANKANSDKPKIPSKPDKVIQMVRKSSIELPPLPPGFLSSPCDQNKQLSNKRRAPNPPPTTIDETVTASDIYIPSTQAVETSEQIEVILNLTANNLNTPQFIVPQEEITPCNSPSPDLVQTSTPVYNSFSNASNISSISTPIISNSDPEPAPRKNFSASNDNLTSAEKFDEKRKDKTRSRFSLMKFLRVGGSSGKSADKVKLEDIKEKLPPLPKPRLVIVHPLEFNGSIEMVHSPTEECSGANKEGSLPPAPPPRNISRTEDLKPPPKSDELLHKQRQLPPTPPKAPVMQTSDNVYANLGEVRSTLVPSKPQRTASMREREALEQQMRRRNGQEHLYEKVSPPRRHSDESNNNNNIGGKELRLTLKAGSYSGSEPDLEIYSPCGSYYGSECEISEGGCSRPCRLRSRKGRSIVHRNLEDNYGAVVVANHEALAQVLENLHQSPPIQPAFRGLQSAPVLRWCDFSIVDNAPGMVVGRRAFYHALWGAHHITLSVSKDQSSLMKNPVGLSSFSLVPITEFSDLVIAKYLPGTVISSENDLVQATITILPWTQLDTIQTYGSGIKSKNQSTTEINRDACFILLQLVNGLKVLQAQGIEEVPLSLNNFILCHDIDRDTHHRLCFLQGFSEEVSRTEAEPPGSLCQCATVALEELFTTTKLAALIKTLLKKESAMSLSQVKSILEFSLWGPSDVAQGVPIKDRELALQRWLDLERATVLHGLVGTRVQLSVLEECHLLFLVRSSAKTMCDASLLLESNGVSINS